MTKPQAKLLCPTFSGIAAREHAKGLGLPFFSLSKNPIRQPIEYTSSDGYSVKVSPGYEGGMATIWDADILIWCASQIVEARDRGLEPSADIKLVPHDILRATRRGVGGKDFVRLHEALERLTRTTIRTNVITGNQQHLREFHWLEGFDISKVHDLYRSVTATVPQWLFAGIMEPGGVLTLNPDYFSLTGGIDRWLYRVARKHVGAQKRGFRVKFATLYEKSGSPSRRSAFSHKLRTAIKTNRLPDYHLESTTAKDGAEAMLMLPRAVVRANQTRAMVADLGKSLRAEL